MSVEVSADSKKHEISNLIDFQLSYGCSCFDCFSYREKRQRTTIKQRENSW